MTVSAVPPSNVVLYIDSLKAGGAERVTLTMSRWLVEEGHQPVILTRQSAERDFYPLPPGVRRAVEPPDSHLVRKLGWFGFPFRVLRLRRWLRGHRINLAIGITTLPAVKLLLASRALGLTCVVSERNYPPARPPAPMWRLLRRVSYPWADLHLVQTRATGRWLAQHLGVTRQQILPNPVTWPLDRFDPCIDPEAWLATQGVGPDARILLAAGTKLVQKGFDLLVKAFLLLAKRHPEVHLVIVGLDSSPYKGRNQQAELHALLAEVPSIASRFHCPGKVGNIADWYQIADLFVLTSRYEGFPNVLLEAMSAGCVCVAADCMAGPADLIDDGLNGILLPAHADERDWADCLDRLLGDDPARKQLAANALAVHERFAERRVRQQFIQALAALRLKDV